VEKILVVDDEKSLREVMSIMLKRAGYEVTEASDGEQAIGQVNREIYDLVITDLRMPKADGMDVLKAVKSSSPETVVLVVTAFGTADSAVEAMKQGAYDYLTKPFQVDEVQLIIRNALEKRRLSTENMLLKREMASQSSFAQIVGQSEAMQKVFDVVRKVADSKSNVLICGESGTGKELVARAIHYNSARSPMPFVAVNCSAVPETLLESELFGHMKGSFTGAVANKAGLFEIANGGTIFLDEIGDTTPAIQVKLLRVIQEREFRRVGGTQDMKVDVRVVAATNRDLNQLANEGRFRADLLYRLNIVELGLPPLRARVEDIPALVESFNAHFCARHDRRRKEFTPEFLARLAQHPWPGNIRQLRNLIERLIVTVRSSTIGAEHAPTPPSLGNSAAVAGSAGEDPLVVVPRGMTIAEAEAEMIRRTLEKITPRRDEAAKLLGLSRRALHYKIKTLRLV